MYLNQFELDTQFSIQNSLTSLLCGVFEIMFVFSISYNIRTPSPVYVHDSMYNPPTPNPVYFGLNKRLKRTIS